MSAELLRRAAEELRERAEAATPGPWRDSTATEGVRFGALVADVPHPERLTPEKGGWAWDDAYGGCLVGESLMSQDRAYIAAMHPGVGTEVSVLLDLCSSFLAAGGEITAAVIEAGGGHKTVARTWLIDPIIDIPQGASDIHGVTTQQARLEGRPAVTAVTEIAMDLLSCSRSGLPIVGHNASYDLTMLWAELVRHGHIPLANGIAGIRPVVDTFVLSKWLQPYRPKAPTKRTPDPAKCGSYNLVDSCRINGIDLTEDDAHGAEADALAAGRLAWRLAHTYPGAQGDAMSLHAFQIDEKARQDASYADWLTKQGEDASHVTGQWPLVQPPAGWTPTQTPTPAMETAS